VAISSLSLVIPGCEDPPPVAPGCRNSTCIPGPQVDENGIPLPVCTFDADTGMCTHTNDNCTGGGGGGLAIPCNCLDGTVNQADACLCSQKPFNI